MRTVFICQSKSCRKSGSEKVFQAFQEQPIPTAAIEVSGCLGQCGNGPMVLVTPDEVWYNGVQPEEVGAIVERHLRKGEPVKAMLYRKFHHY